MPGNPSGGTDGIGLAALTTDLSDPVFAAQIVAEQAGGDDTRDRHGPASPQALNRYSYVQNNPVRYTDPTGHWVITLSYGGRVAGMLSGSASGGIAFDGTSWRNYATGGYGVAYPGGVGTGLTVSFYDLPTVADIAGAGTQVGVDVPMGLSLDALGNGSKIVGFAVTIPRTGVGTLANVHGERTWTELDFFAKLAASVTPPAPKAPTSATPAKPATPPKPRTSTPPPRRPAAPPKPQ